MDVEWLYQEYQDEPRKLVAINEKNDFSASGDAEFQQQRERVASAKEAVIRASMRTMEKAS